MLATTRPAFRIFFEHLQQLSEGFEAHVVDALEPTWTTGDWESYIEINRAIAQGRPAKVSTEKLHVYHRTLLRALTLPHRRRAGAEVAAILSAAVEVLPPEDPQLRTTLRRFASAWKGPAVNQPPAVSPSSPQPSHEKEVSQPAPAADAATNDFEEPWK
jgi:hypothetical protein